jgi:hypothetical protein
MHSPSNGPGFGYDSGAGAGGGGDGSGTVTSVSASVPAGLAVVVSNPTTTPAVTVTTSLSGVLKGTGAGFAAAVAGTDYLTPSTPTPQGALSGAMTLTAAAFGTEQVCGGTGPYIVTLPTAVGHAGQWIRLRMAGSLTGLVTLATTASQTIDGTATRVLWAAEVATLESDGADWSKIAGRALPMTCVMRLAGGTPSMAQAIANDVGAYTVVALNQIDIDPTGLMGDTTDNQIVIQRPGNYIAVLETEYAAISGTPAAGAFATATFELNGVPGISFNAPVVATGAYPVPTGTFGSIFAAGDHLQLATFQNTGVSQYLYGDTVGSTCYLSVCEILSW